MVLLYYQQGNKLTSASSTTLGISTGVYGNTAATVSAESPNGACVVYTKTKGIWSQQQKITVVSGSQGGSVAVYKDTIISGGTSNTSPGASWVFTRSGSTWTQQQQLIGTGNTGNSLQGYSVSVYEDTVAVGGPADATNVGATWVFTRSAGTWSQQGSKIVGTGITGLVSGQGTSVSVYKDTLAIGGPTDNTNIGAVWIFTRTAGTWTQQQKLIGTGYTLVSSVSQGTSVSLYEDTVVFGGNGNGNGVGAIWIFTRTAGTWTQLQLINPYGNSASSGTSFGRSVSMYGDIIAVGASGDNSGVGSLYIYKKGTTLWNQKERIVGTGNTGSSAQGTSVSVYKSSTIDNIGLGGNADNSVGAVWMFDAISYNQYNNSVTSTLNDVQIESHSSRHSVGGQDVLSLANGKLWVGNTGNTIGEVTMSGDATISGTGVLTLSSANTNPGVYNTRTNTNLIFNTSGRITNVYNYFPIYVFAFWTSGTLSIANNTMTTVNSTIFSNTVGLATTYYMGGLSPNITFSNGTITINETGLSYPNASIYVIHCMFGTVTTSGCRQICVEYTPNGSVTKYWLVFNSVGPAATASISNVMCDTGLYTLSSGDTLTAKTYQNSGSASNVSNQSSPAYAAFKINSNIYSFNSGSAITAINSTTITNSLLSNSINNGNITGYNGGSGNAIVIGTGGIYVGHYQIYFGGVGISGFQAYVWNVTTNDYFSNNLTGNGTNTGSNGDPHFIGISAGFVYYFAAGSVINFVANASGGTVNTSNSYLSNTVNAYFNMAMITPSVYLLGKNNVTNASFATNSQNVLGITSYTGTSGISVSGNNIVIGVTGVYMLFYKITVGFSVTTSDTLAFVAYNGNVNAKLCTKVSPQGLGFGMIMSSSGIYTLKASDTLTFYTVVQNTNNSSYTINCTSPNEFYFNVVKLD